MQPGLCKAKKLWDVPEQTTLSASSGLRLLWTLCPVTRAARAQKPDEAPIILLCFAVTSYYFYMLWRKGLEEPVHDFWKYLLGVGRQWSKTLLHFASWLSPDDLPQWQEPKFSPSVEPLHRVFWWLIPSPGAKKEWSQNIWVSFQGWNYFLGDIPVCKAQEALASPVCGCSSLPPPQVLN